MDNLREKIDEALQGGNNVDGVKVCLRDLTTALDSRFARFGGADELHQELLDWAARVKAKSLEPTG